MAQFTLQRATMTSNDATRLDDRDLPPKEGPSGLARIGRALTGLLIAAWAVFLLLWLALYGFLLPRVSAWKPEMEAQAARVLGVGVRIGDIEVTSTGWIPALRLADLELLDAGGRVALRLPQLSAALSPRSLLSLQPRFEQLLIEGAALEVRRDAQGRLHVAGMALDEELEPQQGTPFDATDWLLAQGEFAIRGAQVRWIDEMRGAPPLVLQDVDFVLRNGLKRHDLRLDATPPAGFGARWTVRGRFRQGLFDARSDWRTWSGELYAELPQTDVAAWRPHLDLPRELRAGQGAARVWVDVDRGRLRGATADVALQAVQLRWAGVDQDLAVERLQGRLLARQDPQAVMLGIEQLSFTTAQGLVWPASDMKLVLRHAPQQPKAPVPAPGAEGVALPVFELFTERQITGGEFSAARLDLALMASIAARAPLGAEIHQWVRELAPQGRIEDMKASWEGPPDDPRRYRVSGRLADLSVLPAAADGVALAGGGAVARAGRPGLMGAGVTIEATETGGRADVEIQRGRLLLPGVLEESSVPVEALSARVAWQRKGAERPELEISVTPLTLRNADLSGELRATWRTRWGPQGFAPGQLDLNLALSQVQAESVWRYLPVRLEPETRSYIRRAVRGGRLQDVALRIRGELEAFPYSAPGAKGEFSLSGRWRDGTLLYLPAEGDSPAWPEATRLDARFRLDGRRFDFSDVRGRILGMEVPRGTVRIDLAAPGVPLGLDLQARGAAQELLRFVQATPVDRWTARAMATATATGPAQLGLRLDIPLSGPEPGKVRGSVQLPGNDLRLLADLPLLAGVRGRVDFTERGFSILGAQGQTAGAQATLLGGDVTIDGGLAPGSGLRLNLQGSVGMAALRAAPELQWLEPIAKRLSGQSAYRLTVGQAPGGPLQWTLNSPLSGVGIDLPAPLGKAPETNWGDGGLRLQVSDPSAGSGPRLQRIDLDAGRLLKARLIREAAEGGRVLQGMVTLGAGELPGLPAQGMEWVVRLDRLDADAWGAVLGAEGVAGTGPGAGPGAGPAAGSAPPAGAASVARGVSADTLGLMPRTVRLQAGRLRFLGRDIEDVAAVVARAGGEAWRVDLNARQLEGRLDWWPQAPGRQARVVARLSRLSIPAANAELVEQAAEDPDLQWPALDVVAEAFELRGRALGRLAIEADVREGGRHWELRSLNLRHPDAELKASGSWAEAEGTRRRRTALDFSLALKDSGALLSKMGYADTLRGGQGSLRGAVAWRGSPMSPDIRSMQGQMRLDLTEGRFLKADPGAARLLGVLSLQSLPRRLILDFRDVFQEGFAFDLIDGDVDIAAGVAQTRNLRMRGLQAAVLMEGRADILHETQDLRVVVVPEVNAGTASLAYAAVNPVLGLGTFLAQLFLRRPLMVANTREFTITGSWDDPKVERVQRAVGPTQEQMDRAAQPSRPVERAGVPGAAAGAASSAAPGPAPAAVPVPNPNPSPNPNPNSNPQSNPGANR